VADPVDPGRTNVYLTKVYTGGVNYIIQGNTKIQLNYNSIRNPEVHTGTPYQFHNVRNNAFIINFQVAF
jgi:hypothetical protein